MPTDRAQGQTIRPVRNPQEIHNPEAQVHVVPYPSNRITEKPKPTDTHTANRNQMSEDDDQRMEQKVGRGESLPPPRKRIGTGTVRCQSFSRCPEIPQQSNRVDFVKQ